MRKKRKFIQLFQSKVTVFDNYILDKKRFVIHSSSGVFTSCFLGELLEICKQSGITFGVHYDTIFLYY